MSLKVVKKVKANGGGNASKLAPFVRCKIATDNLVHNLVR
jgi:hypothetical protein